MGRKTKYSMEELKDVEVEITEKEFKLARSIARRYRESSCRRLTSEDIEQEVLAKLVEVKKIEKLNTGLEPEENLSLVKAIMENMARDLYRKDSREKERYVTMDMNSSSQRDVGQEQAESVMERMGVDLESFEEVGYTECEAIELFNKFMSFEIDVRIKKYFVVMAYWNSGLEFLAKPFKKIYDEMSEEDREFVESRLKSNKRMEKNVAYVIAGYGSGNNGSTWKARKAMELFGKMVNEEDVDAEMIKLA